MAIICTPSALVSAAKCFNCLTTKQLRSVRAYLLSQFVPCVPAGSPPGTPPVVGCNAPAAPANLEVSPIANNPSGTTITIDWTQPASNPPVTTNNYAIIWSVPRGPINFAVIPGTQLSYTITGLTPSTDYSIVVRAIHGACASSSSVLHTTTTSGASNGLLNSVISYTPLNDSSVVLGTGAVADKASPGRVFSAPNTAVISGAGTGNINPVADFHTNFIAGNGLQRIQSADPTLNFPANQKFTAIAWVNFSVREAGFSPFYCNWGASGFFMGEDNAGNNIIGLCHDGAGGTHTVTGPAFNTGQWYFVAVGWDGVNFWISVNAGALTTTAVATLQAYTDSLSIGSYPGGGVSTPTNGFIGGCGLWFRSLTATDLTNLYNGGSGLTFNQFTP